MEKQEIPKTLSQIAQHPDVRGRWTYGTLRAYSSRYTNFPKPAFKNSQGKGMSWYPSEVIHFLKNKMDNRGKKPEETHKGRILAAPYNDYCSKCSQRLYAGFTLIEFMPKDSTSILWYCKHCAKALDIYPEEE